MIKGTILVAALIFSLFFVMGCGDNETLPDEEDGISIEVANNSEELVIAHAAFFGEGLDDWGEDLLKDEIIAPDEVYTFILPEGEYDLSLFNQDFFVINSYFGLTEDTRIDIGGDGRVPILVQNTSDYNLLLFYAFPGGLIDLDFDLNEDDEMLEEEWAEVWDEIWMNEDYLQYQLLHEREAVRAETGRRFFFLTPGNYDFLIINEEVEPFLELDIEIEDEGPRKVITID